MRHLSETHETYVNQLLELMEVSSSTSQCVKRCQQDCIRDGSLTLICRNSRLDIIELTTLKIWSCLFSREQNQKVKSRVFSHLENRKKIDCFNVDGYCDHCKTVFEAMGCYYHFCSCQEARTSLTDQDFERGNKKREMDDMRREYIKEKGYKVEELWECDWCESFKTNDKIKNHVRTNFPYKKPFSTDSLLAKIKDGSLFGYIQCDLVVLDELKSKLANFPPISKKTEVVRKDIGE